MTLKNRFLLVSHFIRSFCPQRQAFPESIKVLQGFMTFWWPFPQLLTFEFSSTFYWSVWILHWRCHDIHLVGLPPLAPRPLAPRLDKAEGARLFHSLTLPPPPPSLRRGRSWGVSGGTWCRFLKLLQSKAAEKGSNLKPIRVMQDFERALKKATLEVFPHAQIKGCFFHFCQCFWRKLQGLGLAVAYARDPHLVQDGFSPSHVACGTSSWRVQLGEGEVSRCAANSGV